MAHFPGNASKKEIHTTRDGTCIKGACDYRKNTTPALAWDPWEAHHILCFYSVNAYTSSVAVVEIDASYKMTDWCLNQKDNMIALPKKQVYRDFHKQIACITMNLPCHNLHHNCTGGYTDEVTAAIKKQIWDKVEKAAAQAKQNQQHFTPADVLSDLQALEKQFRATLHQRGATRAGGTQTAWGNQGSITNGWWLAFSMAEDSIALGRPRPIL